MKLILCVFMALSASNANAEMRRETYSGVYIPVPVASPPVIKVYPMPIREGQALQVKPVTELKPHWLFRNLLKQRTRFVIEPIHRVSP